MKIHFFVLTSFPVGMAAAKRRLCYARGLIAAGDSVDVSICQKCFSKNENDKYPESGIFRGIPYKYVAGKVKSDNRVKRKLDYCLLDYLKGFVYALRKVKKGEVIYCYFYSNFFHLLLIIASKIKGAKIVREVCEHPSALYDMSRFPNRANRWFEYHCLFPLFDGFIPISKDLSSFVEKYKSSKAQSIIIPILVDEIRNEEEIKSKGSPYDIPYIIHTGTMLEQKDSISKIIKAFARFKRETNLPAKLVFTGPHANERCSYIPLMKELGVDKDVDLLGLVDPEEVTRLQQFASLTIIYKSDNLQTRNCFPTKLGEMLACGCPVVTTSVGDANLYLKNKKNALIFNEDDEDMLVEHIKHLLTDSDDARRIGEAGKLVALSSFNPIEQGKLLSEFYNKL